MKLFAPVFVLLLACPVLLRPAAAQISTAEQQQQDLEFAQFVRAGNYERAAELATQALHGSVEANGAEHVDVALRLLALAKVEHRRGKFALAQSYAERALLISEKLHSPEHPDVARCLVTLSAITRGQGRYSEALTLALRALTIFEGALAPDDPDVAIGLIRVAQALRWQNRNTEAENMLKRALAVRERAFGTDDPGVSEILDELAAVYRDLGRLDLAQAYAQRALTIHEKASGPEHFSLSSSLYMLGLIAFNRGQYAQAASFYQRALAVKEPVFGASHHELAPFLNELSRAYRNQGRYADAEPPALRALQILEVAYGPEHREVAMSLDSLGLLYRLQGRYEAAEATIRRALAIVEKPDQGTAHDVINVLSGLPLVYLDQGRYREAEALLRRALALGEASLPPTDRLLAQIVNNLAATYARQGRYRDAEPLQRRALDRWEQALGSEHRNVGTALNNLANLYRLQHRLELAEPLMRRALAIFEKALGPNHRDVGRALEALAVIVFMQDRVAEAEVLLLRAVVIHERSSGLEHMQTTSSMTNLASVLRAEGRHDEAQALLLRTLPAQEKALGPDHPNVAGTLQSLAMTYGETGRSGEQEVLLLRALKIREVALGEGHPDVARVLELLSEIRSASRFDEALPLIRRATSIRRARAKETRSDASDLTQTGVRSELQSARSGFVTHVRLLAAMPMPTRDLRDDRAAESFEVAQLARATDTASAVSQMAERFSVGDDELAALVRSRQDRVLRMRFLDAELLKELSRPGKARDTAAADRLRGAMRDAETQLRDSDAALERGFPEYQALTGNLPLSLVEARSLILPKEALLSYLIGEQESYLWVVRRDQQAFLKLTIGRKELEIAVSDLRRALDAAPNLVQPLPYPAPLAHALYLKIIAPAAPLLAGVEHLLIVPDRALQSLPLAVLISEPPAYNATYRDFAWLAKRYAFSTLPSEASLKALRRFAVKRMAPDPFVGFGDPDFKGAPGSSRSVRALYSPRGLADVKELSQLARLPDSALEISAMASALGGNRRSIFLGAAATETQVKRLDIGRYRTLAFATHGFMAGEIAGMVEPALALTPPAQATDEDDGLLTAGEIAQLKLNADWVILSACNTAAPDGTPAGEGLSGLARAFIFAGSRSLLVSHWPVDSRATARLTTQMLREIRKRPGTPKSEALQRAMLNLLNNAAYSHPIFWAPFVFVGA